MLLDKIIDLATDNQQPLTVLLRQCIVLAYDLKNEGLKEWANHELNGYPDPAKVPEYRMAGLEPLESLTQVICFQPSNAPSRQERWRKHTGGLLRRFVSRSQ